MSEQKRFGSYPDFFVHYLEEHSDSRNRILHAAGTLTGLGIVVAAFIFKHPLYALAWPVAGYGFAWIGHFLIERNKPATFQHPFWSFRGDFHMLWLMMTGRLGQRLAENARSVVRE